MELLFQSTKAFEKDLRKLGRVDRERVVHKINDMSELLLTDRSKFLKLHAYRPRDIQLRSGSRSTLWVFRVNDRLRVLMTIDEDPIFDQMVVTLFRAIPHDEVQRTFASMAGSIYQDQLANITENQESSDGAD